MNTYYKLKINGKYDRECDVKLLDEFQGNLTEEQIQPILQTHKAPAYWSYGPHDWGKFEADVEIIKVTEEIL